MTKCPHCGSTAQIKILNVDFELDGDEYVYIHRYYKCGCGTYFRGTVTYIKYHDGGEIIDREEKLR